MAQPSARFMKPSEQWGCRQQTRREFTNEHGEQRPELDSLPSEGTKHDHPIPTQSFWSPNMFCWISNLLLTVLTPHLNWLNFTSHTWPTLTALTLRPRGHVGVQRQKWEASASADLAAGFPRVGGWIWLDDRQRMKPWKCLVLDGVRKWFEHVRARGCTWISHFLGGWWFPMIQEFWWVFRSSLFFPQEFHCWWAPTGEGPPIVEDLAHTGAQLCKRSRDLQRAAPVNLETGVGGDEWRISSTTWVYHGNII